MAREVGDLAVTLLARARSAVARAQAAVQRSEMLRSSTRRQRGSETMTKHCAWCGRVFLGGRWVPADHAPQFIATALDQRATHTICDECVARLEADGMSAPRLVVHREQPGDADGEDDQREP